MNTTFKKYNTVFRIAIVAWCVSLFIPVNNDNFLLQAIFELLEKLIFGSFGGDNAKWMGLFLIIPSFSVFLLLYYHFNNMKLTSIRIVILSVLSALPILLLFIFLGIEIAERPPTKLKHFMTIGVVILYGISILIMYSCLVLQYRMRSSFANTSPDNLSQHLVEEDEL